MAKAGPLSFCKYSKAAGHGEKRRDFAWTQGEGVRVKACGLLRPAATLRLAAAAFDLAQ
jgi:hypothetical protein